MLLPTVSATVPSVISVYFRVRQSYLTALEYAPYDVRSAYEEDAVFIDKVQKDILALVQKQEAFDVFICYKETDESGERSNDSVLAQKLEFELSKRGYRVFLHEKHSKVNSVAHMNH